MLNQEHKQVSMNQVKTISNYLPTFIIKANRNYSLRTETRIAFSSEYTSVYVCWSASYIYLEIRL